MLEFQQPWWLLLLLLVPLLYWWYLRRGRSREGVLRFSSLALFDPTDVRTGGLKAGLLLGARFLLMVLVILRELLMLLIWLRNCSLNCLLLEFV